MFIKFRVEYISESARTKWERFEAQNKSRFWFGYALAKDGKAIEVEFDDPTVPLVEARRKELVRARLEQALVKDGQDVLGVSVL